jgi:Rad3-related DNA helicase
MATAKAIFSVSVRDLVEFVLRRGDLGSERDFVGRNRALAGTRGHQEIQRSRPAAYQKEIRLKHQIETEEFILRIEGRLDGLLITESGVLLEEIKTVQVGWSGQADDLHWAQAKCYGFIYAHQQALGRIRLQLTYLDLESGKLTEFHDDFTLQDLNSFFETTAAVYLEWITERHRWCQTRDESIRALAFPFPRYRPGQREVAVAAYRTIGNGGRLFLEAPTGIGKTISVLFPAVKALGESKVERIFYLTARTVGRMVAQTAFAEMRRTGLRLRTLTLTAREKICVREGQPCDRRTCPLGLGYYDRSKTAMRQALARDEITRSVLEEIGHANQVCPYQLSLDLSTWMDAIICDYNYVFDPKAYLRRHFAEEARDYVFLVDEAHNLADRARDMFSADLRGREIQEVRRAIQKAVPRCAKALSKLNSAMRNLCDADGHTLSAGPPPASVADTKPALFQLNSDSSNLVTSDSSADVRVKGMPVSGTAQATRKLPADLVALVDEAADEAECWLCLNQPAEFRQSLLDLFFELHSFSRTAALYDERYVTIIEPNSSVRVRLYCLDPSFLLREALARGKAAIFFSATLAPLDYYQALLGGSPEDSALRLPSPFPPENLAVLIHHRIRTHLKARAETLLDVVRAIGVVIQSRPGNYLAFFPSYQYLADAQEQFRALYPTVAVLVQRPALTETEREAFLTPFARENEQTLVGFAVMGGIFGEGIDLVGDRLLGAIIVGVGLPQLCIERDLIRDYFQERARAGFEYAYMFPGLNRVLQAVGRVIRSETDRGVVLLIDNRFIERRYLSLLPPSWRLSRIARAAQISEALRRFWQAKQPTSIINGVGS